MNTRRLPHKPRRDELLTDVVIEALDERGEGVAHVAAQVGPQQLPIQLAVHVRRAVPGDRCDVRVTGSHRRRLDGYVAALHEPSPLRIAPRCQHFLAEEPHPGCGGCSLQQLDLATQRDLKRDGLRELFARQQLDPALVEPVVGVGDGWYYRNKMDFTFAGQEPGEFGLGMRPSGFRYEVIDHRECLLMSPFVSDFIPAASAWARDLNIPALRGDHGFWRSLVIREGKNTGERMLELVTSQHEPSTSATSARAVAEAWRDWVLGAYGEEVTSLYWTQVRAVRGERTRRFEHHLHGRPTLRETLTVAGRTLSFEIAPTAFFQTNTAGAELLYSIAAEHAAPTGDEFVLDLYSGTGTIGLCLAPSARAVLGIELVEAAVLNARANAAANGIDNAEFVAGDVGEVLSQRRPNADVVVVDPPRAGLLASAHDALENIDAQRLVYVSCNPESLVRDLALLTKRWAIERVRPVDMFPQTPHVETVVSLTR